MSDLSLFSQVFLHATKRMEGHSPTGCILLAEYSRIVLEVHWLEEDCTDPDFRSMLDLMRIKLEGYQDEAVSSDVIVLSKIFNPRFQI